MRWRLSDYFSLILSEEEEFSFFPEIPEVAWRTLIREASGRTPAICHRRFRQFSRMSSRNRHCSQAQLAGYVRRELPWRELLQVDHHLASCEDCAGCLARRADVRRARSVLRAVVGANSHFAYEQLEALAESKLALTGALEAHVSECHACHSELRDLQVFVSSFRVATPTRSPLWLDSVRRWFERPLQLAGSNGCSCCGLRSSSRSHRIAEEREPRNGQLHGRARHRRGLRSARSRVRGMRRDGVVARVCGVVLVVSEREDQELTEALRAPAEAGNQIAQATLGILIAKGQGADRDLEAARTWLGKAAAQGDSCAQQALSAIKDKDFLAARRLRASRSNTLAPTHFAIVSRSGFDFDRGVCNGFFSTGFTSTGFSPTGFTSRGTLLGSL